jgi:hypothetical protein
VELASGSRESAGLISDEKATLGHVVEDARGAEQASIRFEGTERLALSEHPDLVFDLVAELWSHVPKIESVQSSFRDPRRQHFVGWPDDDLLNGLRRPLGCDIHSADGIHFVAEKLNAERRPTQLRAAGAQADWTDVQDAPAPGEFTWALHYRYGLVTRLDPSSQELLRTNAVPPADPPAQSTTVFG